jgi:hypothetical protein
MFCKLLVASPEVSHLCLLSYAASRHLLVVQAEASLADVCSVTARTSQQFISPASHFWSYTSGDSIHFVGLSTYLSLGLLHGLATNVIKMRRGGEFTYCFLHRRYHICWKTKKNHVLHRLYCTCYACSFSPWSKVWKKMWCRQQLTAVKAPAGSILTIPDPHRGVDPEWQGGPRFKAIISSKKGPLSVWLVVGPEEAQDRAHNSDDGAACQVCSVPPISMDSTTFSRLCCQQYPVLHLPSLPSQ